MAQVMKTYFASVISEIEQSDIYLTIKARLFEAPEPNLNGVRVTEGFIDEIIENSDKYIGLPLSADIKNLTNGNYEHLGHMYDSRTGKFHSTTIGSFVKYEKETIENGCCLVGYARVMKRNKEVCEALQELFSQGKLKFSFEISCSEYKKLPDDTIEIDAADGNFFEGEAVVTLPACESAVALDLVAEVIEPNDDKKGDCDMADVEHVNTEAVAEENAEVIVTQEHCEHDSVTTYDTETGTETIQTVDSHVEVREIAETSDDGEKIAETKKNEDEASDPDDSEDETSCLKKCGEDDTETAACKKNCGEDDPEKKDPTEEALEEKPVEDTEKKEEEDAACKKQNAEIAELLEIVNDLKQQIAELKASQITASKKIDEIAERNSQANPFMASIKIEDNHKKYSLLEPVEKHSTYSLLD